MISVQVAASDVQGAAIHLIPQLEIVRWSLGGLDIAQESVQDATKMAQESPQPGRVAWGKGRTLKEAPLADFLRGAPWLLRHTLEKEEVAHANFPTRETLGQIPSSVPRRFRPARETEESAYACCCAVHHGVFVRAPAE